jgi:putative CocE/NonD family hydrolase
MILFAVAMVAAGLIASVTTAQETGGEPISRLGEYSGYSESLYTESVRTSEYMTVRDGTRIAVDIIRPSVGGVAVAEPLPIILTYERYHRASFTEDGQLVSQLNGQTEAYLRPMLEHGYIIAAVDIRGAGASFGSRDMEFMDIDSTDAYDVIEWLGKQTWSNGSVGMYDFSYPGITQYMAAGAAPSALKAIIPQNASFDLYSFFYPGGIFNQEFVSSWTGIGQYLDNLMPPVPVDADTDGSMAAAAQQEHQANAALSPLVAPAPFRDDEITPGIAHDGYAPYRFIEGINQSGVAVYHIGGWYDGWPRDAAVWFNNLNVPQRLLLTPFSHQIGYDPGWLEDVTPLIHDDFNAEAVTVFQAAEHMRFFDYFLKGIDNGIMDEPSVWYYTLGAPEGEAWRSAESWPLPNEVRTNFYLTGDTAESVNSVNDGLLTTSTPTDADGQDDYVVDYTTTMGTATRWVNMHAGPFDYSDMTANDEHALTYTTGMLLEDLEITGHPIVHLWVTSTADDSDFFVYLSEVDENGYAHYLTEGALRASHRALSQAPYDYMGLPYHRSFAEDLQSLPAGEPVELIFDLLPTSNIFDAGHRIRVTIMGADADTFATPQLDPAPTVSIYRNAEHSSYIDLPIIPAG